MWMTDICSEVEEKLLILHTIIYNHYIQPDEGKGERENSHTQNTQKHKERKVVEGVMLYLKNRIWGIRFIGALRGGAPPPLGQNVQILGFSQ